MEERRSRHSNFESSKNGVRETTAAVVTANRGTPSLANHRAGKANVYVDFRPELCLLYIYRCTGRSHFRNPTSARFTSRSWSKSSGRLPWEIGQKGQAIPSIRRLAVDLEVSVITVKRAYYELEREGIIVTQHAKGSHVACTPGLGARLREEELRRHLEQAMRIAEQLGIRPEELEERLRDAGDRLAAKETI